MNTGLCWVSRLRLTLFAALLLQGFIAQPAFGQGDTLNATMLRRLGEVADGYRTGSPIYLVMAVDPPYPAAGAFETDSAAQLAARKETDRGVARYHAFGPYLTSNQGPEIQRLVRLTAFYRDSKGADVAVDIDRDVDLVVLSVSAYEKFVAPYQVKIQGVAWTNQFRQDYFQRVKPMPPSPLCHKGSMFIGCWPPVGPGRPGPGPGQPPPPQ